jgi:hypothetical protein
LLDFSINEKVFSCGRTLPPTEGRKEKISVEWT